MFSVTSLIAISLQLLSKGAELFSSSKKTSTPTSSAVSTALLYATQAGAAAELAQKLQSEGRDETTEEEAADLQAVLDREVPEDQRFDDNVLKALKNQGRA